MIEGRCLPEEDSINFRLGAMPCLWLGAVCAVDDFPDRESRPDVVDVVVIDLPHISNITDIDALRAESGVRVRVVRRLEDIGRPHVALLLGSKMLLWICGICTPPVLPGRFCGWRMTTPARDTGARLWASAEVCK
jgi:hypothetical protein